MLLRHRADRTLGLADLKDGKPTFSPSGVLRAERARGDLSSCHTVISRILGDVLGSALDAGSHRRVRAGTADAGLALAEELTAHTGQELYWSKRLV